MSKHSFFSMDGPFYRIGSLIFDFFAVSILWAISSGFFLFLIIGVIGNDLLYSWVGLASGIVLLLLVAPATTAAFYTLCRRARKRDGYVWKDFFSSYKDDFGNSIGLSVLINGLIAILLYLTRIEIAGLGDYFGSFYIALIALQGFFILALFFMDQYAFALVARFEMSFKDYLRNCFLLSIRHLPTTLLCCAITLAEIAATVFFPIFIIILPGLCQYLKSLLLERIFKKYMLFQPDETTD